MLKLVIAICIITSSCKTVENKASTDQYDNCKMEKVKFLFPQSTEAKFDIDFEFCIPKDEKYYQEILAIDPGLKKAESKGRSKCSDNQYLIMGNTHNKDYMDILCKIANLEYVKEINQTFWE